MTWSEAYAFCESSDAAAVGMQSVPMSMAQLPATKDDMDLLLAAIPNGKFWIDGMRNGGSTWSSTKNGITYLTLPPYYHSRLVGNGDCLAAKKTATMSGFNNVDCNNRARVICQTP